MTFYIGTNGNNRHHGTETVMLGKDGNDLLHQIAAVASTLEGQDGNDILIGNDADDSLFGGHGSDHMLGEAGNDYLNGGAGRDYLSGGVGDDLLIGGKGADTFVFHFIGNDGNPVAPGFDRIVDFDPGRDTIEIVGVTAASYDKKTGIVTVDTEDGLIDIAKMHKHLKGVGDDFDLSN